MCIASFLSAIRKLHTLKCNVVLFENIILFRMHYKFKLSHYAAEDEKKKKENICCVKGEGAFDDNWVKRLFKEFLSGCLAQSAVAVEYTDCIYAKELELVQQVSWILH